jgi:hypothetical protein
MLLSGEELKTSLREKKIELNDFSTDSRLFSHGTLTQQDSLFWRLWSGDFSFVS